MLNSDTIIVNDNSVLIVYLIDYLFKKAVIIIVND